ncbi:hypothetical protein CYLTODRAFT_494034 [Cylindrobasidium torrendii FP15055 ss-10]|uniref:Uncharacterized protein n=1 Tax=Cylindrobasidium torrendii FP15055 ss-10 TaxID=1314674 RepID=A0A0D7AZF9_9AGAR|nr:hypothetical protein CYLTODRAFT_494034 [Cylindrobasidium torrendii FP15055 ss-10]
MWKGIVMIRYIYVLRSDAQVILLAAVPQTTMAGIVIDYKGDESVNPNKRDISIYTKAELKRRFPRQICRAGYVIESVDVANKLFDLLHYPVYWEPLPHLDCPGIERILHWYLEHLQDKDKDWFIEVALTGENHLFFKLLICTQGQFLKGGYLGMPEDELPKFVEGEFEEKIREFLLEYGLEKGKDYVWKTQLD